uniref:Phosphofructokinase domain-containing protein n=1 Tax=Lactuca sativa TaxID=4236 RepID=A0A9R1WQK4_LACSA|nr:hypothetical protein LSAT_V11C100027220 [Lactuca sativa]
MPFKLIRRLILRSLVLEDLASHYISRYIFFSGTITGTSRGGYDNKKIVNSVKDPRINQVIIKQPKTKKYKLFVFIQELRRRGLKVAVIGIAKTIDYDIPIIDKSFGFDTAVEEAQRAINTTDVEEESNKTCIGLVKLRNNGKFCKTRLNKI